MSQLNTPTILFVEDESELQVLFKTVMESHGFSVDVAGTGAEAFQLYEQATHDFIALDYDLPDITGLEVAGDLLCKNPNLPIVFVTGRGSEEIAAKALALGVVNYFIKGGRGLYTDILPHIFYNLDKLRREKLERTALRKAIEERDAHLKAFTSNAPEPTFTKDKDGRYTFVNTRFEELVGIKARNCLRKTDVQLFPKDIAENYRLQDKTVWETGEINSLELDVHVKGGVTRRLLARKFPILSKKGAIIALGGVIVDVTDYRKSQERERGIFEHMNAIVTNSAEGIITIDGQGLIETFNPAAENIFGYEAPEVIGQDVSMLAPEAGREAHKAYVEDSFIHAPKIINRTRDLNGRHKDGTVFSLELNVSPMNVEGTRKFIGIFHDITERKLNEESLLQQSLI